MPFPRDVRVLTLNISLSGIGSRCPSPFVLIAALSGASLFGVDLIEFMPLRDIEVLTSMKNPVRWARDVGIFDRRFSSFGLPHIPSHRRVQHSIDDTSVMAYTKQKP